MTIEMTVSGLTLDPVSETPIVLLRDREGRKVVPIWVGALEASSIAAELEKIQLCRPGTHDLMVQVLRLSGARLVKVEIVDLREDTYFATITLRSQGREVDLDARPSDAIALAMRAGCPILVREEVVQATAEIDARVRGPAAGEAAGSGLTRDYLSRLSEEAFGKWRM